MKKIKEMYLILIAVLCLVGMSIYTTYALFTNTTVTTDTAVNMQVGASYTLDINEVKLVNLPAGQSNYIEVTAVNSSSDVLNYNLFYEVLSGDSSTLEAGYSANTNNPVSGTINGSASKKITVGFTNNGSNDIDLKLGIASSKDTIHFDENQQEFSSTITIVTGPLDKSGANAPVLADGMIPVYYDNGVWKKADQENMKKANQWYDYDSKMWANAVMVSSSTRSTYKSADLGTEISMNDILAFYVWIPRYKYTIFNANYTSSSVSAQQIEITFESGTATTGNVTCTQNSYGKQTCSNVALGNTYTHSAFTFGSTSLQGMWVAKFNLACADSGYSHASSDEYICTNLRSTPNEIMIEGIYLPLEITQSKSIASSTYLDGTTTINSHLTKNTEYGALLYFMHSKYGICTDGTCTMPAYNDYSGYLTGCGANSTTCVAYNTVDGMKASSTGNIYGVYDIVGHSNVTVMANMRSSTSSTSFYANTSAMWNAYSVSLPSASEYDAYYYNSDKFSVSNALLGDALGETQGWYGTTSFNAYGSTPMLVRQTGTNVIAGGTYMKDVSVNGQFRNVVINLS